jgi:hypothetical protein
MSGLILPPQTPALLRHIQWHCRPKWLVTLWHCFPAFARHPGISMKERLSTEDMDILLFQELLIEASLPR